MKRLKAVVSEEKANKKHGQLLAGRFSSRLKILQTWGTC